MENSEIRWTVNVPITKNPDWMKILVLACTLPFAIFALILLLDLAENPTLVICTALICVVVFPSIVRLSLWFLGDKYEVEYVLDHMGVANRFTLNQIRTNQKITKAATLIGVAATLAGKTDAALPRYAGTPDTIRQDNLGSILWEKVKHVKYKEEKRFIYLGKGYGRGFSLFCDEENYALVESLVKEHTAHIQPPQ